MATKNTSTSSVKNGNFSSSMKLLGKLESDLKESSRSSDRANKLSQQTRVASAERQNAKSLPKKEQTQRRASMNKSLVSSDDLNNLSELRKQRDQSFGDQALYDYDSVNKEYSNAYAKIKNQHNFSDDDMKRLIDDNDVRIADREGKTYAKKAQKYAEEHPFLGSVRSVGDNLVSAVLGVPQLTYDLYKSAKGENTSAYGGTHQFGNAKEKERETVSEKIDSDLGKRAYGTGMGLADMGSYAALSAATGGLASVPLLSAGATAESSERNARERGVDTTKAALYGAGSGAIDYALNKVGLDKVLKQTAGGSVKEIAKNMAKGAISEGSANAAQEGIQYQLDKFINQDNSEYQMAHDSVYSDLYNKAYAENISKGMTEAKAEQKAKRSAESEAKKYANSIMYQRMLEAGGSGALFGAGMSGARGVIGSIDLNSRQPKNEKVPSLNIEDIGNDTSLDPENIPSLEERAKAVFLEQKAKEQAGSNKASRTSKKASSTNEISADAKTRETKLSELNNELANAQSDLANAVANPESGKAEQDKLIKKVEGIQKQIDEVVNNVEGEDGNLSETELPKEDNATNSAQDGIPTLNAEQTSESTNNIPGLESDGDKVSQMTKKTIPSQVTEEEYNSRYGGDSSFKYKSMDEETSMRNANNYLNSKTMEEAEVELLDPNKRFAQQDVDALMQLNAKLLDMARNSSGSEADALWERSFNLMKRNRVEGSNNAQALQALAKWSRNTPEGMLTWAMSKIAKANDTEAKKAVKKVEKFSKQSSSPKELRDYLMKMNLQMFANGGGIDEILDYIDNNYKDANGRYISLDAKQMAELGKKAANIIKKNTDDSNLTSAQAKQMYDLFEDASNYSPDSREWNVRMASAMKILDESMPSSIGNKIKTIMYDNMLASLRTMVTRNLGGNVVYNALELASKPAKVLADVATSMVTGNRTQKLSGKAIVEGAEGFKKGISDMKQDFKEGTKTTRSGFKSLDNIYDSVAKTFKTQSSNKGIQAINKVLNGYDKIIKTGLELGDRPIYEAAYNANKAELKEIVAKYGDDGIRSGIEDSANISTDDLIESLAINSGLEAVMQNNSGMKQAMMKMKQSLGDISREATGGIDVLSIANSPFVEVPGNMLSRYLQYTPLGFVGNVGRSAGEIKNTGEINQRRMTTELGRNLTGTALSGIATAMGLNGMISDGYSEDKDERKAQQDNGYLEYALTNPVTGRQYDISDIPVIGSKMREGRIYANALQDAENMDEDVKKALLMAAPSALQSGLGDTLFEGINRVTGGSSNYNSQGGVVENLANNLMSFIPSALVPSLVRQTAQYTDDYKRDLGDYNTPEYYLNNFKNSLPGEFGGYGRQSLNPRINTAGEMIEEDQGRDGVQRIWDTFLAPYKSSDYQDVMPELNSVATNLADMTDGAVNPQLPILRTSDLKNTKGYDADAYTHEDLYDARTEFYSRNNEIGHELINSSFYKSLSPEEQGEMLDSLYSASKSVMKENLVRKGLSKDAITKGEENKTLYTTDDKVARLLKDGNTKGAIDLMEQKYYYKKYGVNQSKQADEQYAKGIDNFIDWATTRQANTQAAEEYGYLKSDGSANLKGYEKAKEFFGNDVPSLQKYSSTNTSMEGTTGKTMSDGIKYAIPYLYTDNTMSDEQKGMYITLASKGSVDKLPKKAKAAYDKYGYAGVYQYYLNQNLYGLDKNKDGVISQSEFDKKYDPTETSEEYIAYLNKMYGMSYK